MSHALNVFDNSVVYRVAFMLLFYGFLCISNLVAPIQASFDVERQLCFRDVTLHPTGVTIFLR